MGSVAIYPSWLTYELASMIKVNSLTLSLSLSGATSVESVDKGRMVEDILLGKLHVQAIWCNILL